jgi:hypothetical protein
MGWAETDRRLTLAADCGLRGLTEPAAFESLATYVELVPGAGNRFAGQFCIMSLVALLAGEPHSDAPATASRLIRSFALTLNDSLPTLERQRLKLFAPRIVGTNDGQDECRLSSMRRVLAEEILPRLVDDIFNDQLPLLLWAHPTVCFDGVMHSAAPYLLAFAYGARSAADQSAVETIAEAVAKLLVYSALLAPSSRILCDIAEPTSPAACSRLHKVPPIPERCIMVNTAVAGRRLKSDRVQSPGLEFDDAAMGASPYRFRGPILYRSRCCHA